MGRKAEHVVHKNNVPLRDRGILAKPLSPKETDINTDIDAAREMLEASTSVDEINVNLFGFYKAWINSRMPGTAEAEKPLLAKSLKSLSLTLMKPRGKPMTAKLRQIFFPCPFPQSAVRAINPKFKSLLVPLEADDRVFVIDEQDVVNRLVVEMEYDLARPLREQLLEYSNECEILCAQYCVYRDSRDDAEEDDDA